MEAARVEGEAQLEALGQSHRAASERAAEAAAARLAEAAAELGRVRAQAAAQAAVAARRESELERERDTAQHMLQMLAQRADEREGAWAEREGAWAAGQRQLQAELGAEEGRRRAEMATQKELRVRLGEAERATVAAEAGRAGHATSTPPRCPSTAWALGPVLRLLRASQRPSAPASFGTSAVRCGAYS